MSTNEKRENGVVVALDGDELDVLDGGGPPEKRIERLESRLDDRRAGVADALASYAAAGERHALASDAGRLDALRALCAAAVDRGHEASFEAVLARSFEAVDEPDRVPERIRSNEALSAGETEDRLATFRSIRDDGAAPSGERVGDAQVSAAGAFEGVSPGSSAESVGRPVDSGGAADEAPSGDADSRTDGDADDAGSDAGDGTDASVAAALGVNAKAGGTPDGSADATPETEPPADPIGGASGESAPADRSASGAAASDATEAPEDGHRGELRPPQRTDPTEQGALSMPNYAQDLVNIEFVLEKYDDFVPAGVDGSGMIVVDDREYVGVARVKPRSWSIHTDEKKMEIVQAYRSSFLATLDFPTQIVSYPTKFDISDHVSRLEAVADQAQRRTDDSELVSIGRRLYPNWLERFILDNDMKQRQFYVVVPISADQIKTFQNTNDGLLDALAEKVPPLKPLADAFSGDDADVEVTKQQCIRELDSRLTRIGASLRRFDVTMERLSDRDEVMSVLYHYYNNEQPLNEAFPTGPYSVRDEPGEGQQ